MKIDKIKINGFGKLKNQEIEFGDGINIIYGENEAGKSTLLKFLMAMFFGAAKNKNGRNISDFEKFKPWDQAAFSGKIKYTLDGGKSYEIFREFQKRAPQIYNEFGEEITQKYVKGREVKILENQIGVDENLFSKTAVTAQQEVKIEKNDAGQIVQKISNLISTGDAQISYQKTLEKLTKQQNENVGSSRTKGRPLNIADENIRKLLAEKKQLMIVKNSVQEHDKQREIWQQKIDELTQKKEKIKEQKSRGGEINFEKINQKINIYHYLFIGFMILFFALTATLKNAIISVLSLIPLAAIFILRTKKSSAELKNLQQNSQKIVQKYEAEQENMQEEINQARLKIQLLEKEKENIDEKLEQLARVEEQLAEQQAVKAELQQRDVAYELARECLENAYREMKHHVSPQFTKNLCEIAAHVTAGKYKNVSLDDQNRVLVEVEGGNYMPAEALSCGTIDELYLSLRLSVLPEITAETLPIIFDETFAYFDEPRLQNILYYLQDQYYDHQVVIFSCTKREEEMLNRLKIEYHLLEI